MQGVNIMAFCKEYNARTQDKIGTIIPVEITVFDVSLGLFECPWPPWLLTVLSHCGMARVVFCVDTVATLLCNFKQPGCR